MRNGNLPVRTKSKHFAICHLDLFVLIDIVDALKNKPTNQFPLADSEYDIRILTLLHIVQLLVDDLYMVGK